MSDSVTCICCPLGCCVHIEKKGKNMRITGHICKRGEEYAKQEVMDPRRVLTTTVAVKKGRYCLLPVRSEKEIPKHLVKACVIELLKIKVDAPVKCGDLVCKNILETGIDIIASRDMEREER